jgi:hypothetical protein
MSSWKIYGAPIAGGMPTEKPLQKQRFLTSYKASAGQILIWSANILITADP